MLRIVPSFAFYPCSLSARFAAIGVSHWHSLYDSAYLRHLAAIPDTKLVALQDTSATIAAQRAAELGGPAVYTDYRRMLTDVKPDFVIALGRHSSMAETALYLLDQGYPFLMEKPMGVDADEVRRVADLGALRRLGRAVDARSAGRGRRLPAQSGFARPRSLHVPHRRGCASDRRSDQRARARSGGRGLRLGPAALRERCPGDDRGRQHVSARRHGR